MTRGAVRASRNNAIKKKIEEITPIIEGLPITVLSLDDFPYCPETVEDRDAFEGNSVKRSPEIATYTGKPAFAGDSGLEVDGFCSHRRSLLKSAYSEKCAARDGLFDVLRDGEGGVCAISNEKCSLFLPGWEGCCSRLRRWFDTSWSHAGI